MYPGFDPSPLAAFCAQLGVPHFYAAAPIIDLAASRMGRDSICAWCARMKRGLLYSTARAQGYGTLVLGQHLDDAAESFVMSAFRNGALRTMKAAYINDAGDVRVVRPLSYARERATRAYADALALPVIGDNCPACFAGPTERYHVKKLLAAEEASNPGLFNSLRRTLRPLMAVGGSGSGSGSGGGGGGGDAEDDEAAGLGGPCSGGECPPFLAAGGGGSGGGGSEERQ
jgi:tRNA 2-thiocytidine biosynthesis protein TtcA